MLSGNQSSTITVLAIALLMLGVLANVSWATANIQEEQTQLLINEFMPWPEHGEEEYIEIYNPGGSAVSLDGWLVDDIEGGSAPKRLDGLVVPEGGYLVLWGGFTRVRLNNDGDSVRLIDPDGVVVDQHDYRFSDPGVPFSRLPDGGEWFSPPNPTPGISNGPDPADSDYGANVVISSFMSGATTDWEFISLENMGTPVDLEGWRISDGEGCWKLPAYLLSQGERAMIAANQTLYMMQTGQEADIIPDGRISLGDYGDDIYLFDHWGRLMDVVWYGNMEPEGEGWIGPPMPYPSRGMVAFRNGDTNSSADWCPLNSRVVGATEFHVGVHDVVEASFFVSPDCGYAPILRTLEEADVSLDLNLYQLTSQSLTDGIVHALERGVSVRLILEGGPVGWNWGHVPQEEASSPRLEAYSQLYQCTRIVKAGGDIRFIAPEVEMSSRNQRYRFNHAKYAIADGEILVLGTENWKSSGLPERGKEGNRGWGVVLKSPSLCESLGQVFQSDWEGVLDSVPFGTYPYLPPPEWFSPQEEKWFSRPVVHDERVANGWFQTALIIGPENNLLEEGVLGAINSAENRILLQLMDLKIEWRIFGQDIYNPYVEAVLDAARRGVEVKILLDSRYVVDDGETIDNSHALRWLNDMALDEELPMEARLADLREMDVDKVHTKGMIVDGSMVLVSSLNWNSNSMLRNREVGLLMYNQEAGEYFEQVFMWDWVASGDGENLAPEVEQDGQSSFLFTVVAGGTLAVIGAGLWVYRRR